MTRRWSLLAALVLALLAPELLSGQSRGRIEGLARDSAGAALPGATVEILQNGQTVATLVTDSNGQFRSDLVVGQADVFDIRVSLPGFSVQTLRVGPQQREASTPVGSLLGVTVRLAPLASAAPRGGPRAGDPGGAGGRGGADNHAIVKVFFATDRAREEAALVSYGGLRNQSGQLQLGRFDVSVPRDHRMGSVERPTILTFWREDPTRHFIIVNRMQQSYDTFYGEVSAMVRQSTRKEAFVFIHGYNVTFESAVYRTAQLAYDLGFDGPPILYSWPSEGVETSYPVDQNNNDWTVQHLRWFLEDLSARSGADMIHLIAHSMGNRALVSALRDIAGAGRTRPQPRFNQIVLTAPDIDLGTFEQVANALVGAVGKRITLYASSNDVALKLSKQFQRYQRAGDSAPDVFLLPGIDTIDVSALDTGLLGHSYYGDNTSVLSDIFALLRDGKPPDQRAGLHAAGQAPRRWWVFSP